MIKQYLRSSLFALFFVVATVSTALHELSPHHHSDNCPVCVVDEHSLSADVVSDAAEDEITLFYAQYIFTVNCKQAVPLTTLNARAPPSLFS